MLLSCHLRSQGGEHDLCGWEQGGVVKSRLKLRIPSRQEDVTAPRAMRVLTVRYGGFK